MKEKKCSKCKCILPVDRFTRNLYAKSGLQSQCKDCHSEQQKIYHKRTFVPIPKKWKPCEDCGEMILGSGGKKFCDKCLDEHKRILNSNNYYPEYHKEWMKKHPHYYRDYARNLSDDEKELRREDGRKWREDNPEYNKGYRNSPKGKEVIVKYRQSPKGKKVQAKTFARKRGLGTLALFENPFPDDIRMCYHHVNYMVMMPVPLDIHSIYTKGIYSGEQHRIQMNEIIYNLYGLDIEELLE